MKKGTRVIVTGLDPYRGMVGTFVDRDKVCGFKAGSFKVQLADGRLVFTSSVKRYKEAA
jgi:hypothetical protein